jgi:hypothetical protein
VISRCHYLCLGTIKYPVPAHSFFSVIGLGCPSIAAVLLHSPQPSTASLQWQQVLIGLERSERKFCSREKPPPHVSHGNTSCMMGIPDFFCLFDSAASYFAVQRIIRPLGMSFSLKGCRDIANNDEGFGVRFEGPTSLS